MIASANETATEAAARAEAEAEAEADKVFADALADAFIVHAPAEDEPAPDDEDAGGPPVALPFLVEPDAVAPAASEPAREAAREAAPEATLAPAQEPVATPAPMPEPMPEPTADPEPWVDLVLEPTPKQAPPVDDWVDQVLEPVKLPLPSRPPRARATAAKATGKPPVKAAAKAAAKAPAARNVAVPAAAKPAAEAQPAMARWWLVAPVFLVLAGVLLLNRPGKPHAPVPAGVMGTWTTAFWLYEHQTMEILRDTVVVTLDEPEEGRYPITQVETNDAGRETSVKITYRLPSGDEKVLDFLADKDPTTALRFRSHSGLVWVHPSE